MGYHSILGNCCAAPDEKLYMNAGNLHQIVKPETVPTPSRKVPRIQLYGFIVLSIVLAVGLAWMLESGLLFGLIAVLLILLIWWGVSCYRVQKQLQMAHDARTTLLRIVGERSQLAEKVVGMALKFDEYGALKHELTRMLRDDSGTIANAAIEIDQNIKLAVNVLEKHMDTDSNRRYRKLKLDLATTKTQVAQQCRTYNEIATHYNALLDKPPIKWLRTKLDFPYAPRVEQSDKRAFVRLQKFSIDDGPLFRDVLNTIGKPLCSLGE